MLISAPVNSALYTAAPVFTPTMFPKPAVTVV